MVESSGQNCLSALLSEVKRLAKDYHSLTGRPLGVTGEVGEYEAARLLNLELAEVRQEGYDAIHRSADGEERLQIKTRVVHSGSGNRQRVGSIALTSHGMRCCWSNGQRLRGQRSSVPIGRPSRRPCWHQDRGSQ